MVSYANKSSFSDCPFLRSLGSYQKSTKSQTSGKATPEEVLAMMDLGNPAQALRELHNKFGNSFSVETEHGRVWFDNEADTMRTILRGTTNRNPDFGKSQLQCHGLAQTLGSENLLLKDGPQWESSREALEDLFSAQRVKQNVHLTTILEQVDRHLAGVSEDGTQIDLVRTMRKLTLSIGLKYMFSVESTTDELEKLISAYEIVNSQVGQGWLFLTLATGDEELGTEFIAAQAVIDSYASKIISRRKESCRRREDAVDLLRRAQDPKSGKPYSQVRLHSEVKSLMLAGHETTASLITWCLFKLARHPQRQRKIYDHIISSIGERPPNIEELDELKEVTTLWREEAKEKPPNYLIARQALCNTTIGLRECPIQIGAGDTVIVSTEHANEKSRGMFSFGGGRRFCLGFHLATFQIELILTRFLQKFELIDNGFGGRASGLVQTPADTRVNLKARVDDRKETIL